MSQEGENKLSAEEIQKQKEDLEQIKRSIFGTLGQKSGELGVKVQELQDKVSEICKNKGSEEKQCIDKFNNKLSSESEIFNNQIFKLQTNAFRCFMTAQVEKQSHSRCEQEFINGIDDSISDFFKQMNRIK